MTQTTVSRTIKAPVQKVFETIAHIENFSKAVPDIVRVEMLSETTSGVGTRFRETRLLRGNEESADLEVTEYIENDRVRIVSDTHGAVWDTVFTVRQAGDRTSLKLVMEAKPHSATARVMVPMMKGILERALEKDMDSVKAYCEESMD